jgi:ketosteroid isomerase-like protein
MARIFTQVENDRKHPSLRAIYVKPPISVDGASVESAAVIETLQDVFTGNRLRIAGKEACMRSRAFVLMVGVPIVTAVLTGCRPAPEPANSADADVAAVKQMLIDWYTAYSATDETRYREFLVEEEYVLLENGTVMGVEDDLKAMRGRARGYGRKDAFDFRSVRLHGDLAYATYFLESEIVDDTKIQQRKWLESAVLRRLNGRWRAALLHSTRVSGSDTPRQPLTAPAPPAR